MPKTTPGEQRHIEYVPLDEIVLDAANPKAHDTTLIGDSVGRFGYVEPAIEDGRTGKLISGHGRTITLRTMRDEGQEPPEGVRLGSEGEWLVPISRGWSSRSDSEAQAALIALNRTGEVGGWVDNSLLALLDDLGRTDDGFVGVGYGESDLEDLRSYLETHSLASSWAEGSSGGSKADDEEGVQILFQAEGQDELVVVYEEEYREELYARLAEMPGVINVRNRYQGKDA